VTRVVGCADVQRSSPARLSTFATQFGVFCDILFPNSLEIAARQRRWREGVWGARMRLRPVPPEFANPPAQPERAEVSLSLDVRVMAVTYGGGAEPGRNDAFDPFRVPSIRGQLRFWWRATRGGRCESASELRREEALVWGDTRVASPVKLQLLRFQSGTEQEAARRDANGKWVDEEPRYVLFPAQENRQRIGRISKGGSFQVEIRAPERLVPDLDAALWAWLNFGGIGGRTRRGCGALYCKTYAHTWKAESLLGDGISRDWPTLHGGTMVVGTRKSDWNSCWKECINVLRTFRQDRNHTRARSNWPEPDSIRILRHTHAPNHAPRDDSETFPRAALGLPILFHFKTSGDPDQNTLNVVARDAAGEDQELRLASPVVLKPWAISDHEAIPLLISLNTKPMHEQLAAFKDAKLVLRQKHAPDIPVTQPGRDAIYGLIELAKNLWHGQVQQL